MASEGVIINANAIVALARLPGVTDALHQAGEAVADRARGYVPVRTGALKASIEVIDGDGYVLVGSSMHYAVYVELGTSRMSARPYLRPAASGKVM